MEDNQEKRPEENKRPEEPSAPEAQPTAPGQGKPQEKMTQILERARVLYVELTKRAVEISRRFWSDLKTKMPFLEKIKIPPVVEEQLKKIPIGSPEERVKIIRRGITVILVIVLGILFMRLFCAPKEKTIAPKAGAPAGLAETIPVKAFKVARYNFEDSLNALGSIKGAVEFKLSFEIPGVISSINYREGEPYEEGALLLSLRQDDALLRLKRAQAQLNKAKTQTELAKQKLDEHKKLFAIGAIPESTLEKAELEVDAAGYDAEVASLEVKANESILEKSNLYAPSDGMIGELYVEEGEAVTQNTLIGSHVMTEYVEAEFGVVERDLKKLALGQKAKVYVDAYPDKTFEGVIDNMSPVVTGTSRTAAVRVRIDNPNRFLLPGMFARIRILIFAKRNTIVVPTEAVIGSGDEASVFVIDEKAKTVSQRPIVVGYTRPDYSQIDEGLKEGDLIAISGLERLKDGSKVKILEKQEVEM